MPVTGEGLSGERDGTVVNDVGGRLVRRGHRLLRWLGRRETLAALVFGTGTAVAAGTVPDLLKNWFGDKLPTLLAFVAAGVVLIALAYAAQRRARDGVGIVLYLPGSDRQPQWQRAWRDAATAHAARTHASWFLVEQVLRGERIDEDLAFATAMTAARLGEVMASDPSAPVSLYLSVPFGNAYALGAELKHTVTEQLRVMGQPAQPAGPSTSGSASSLGAIRVLHNTQTPGRVFEPSVPIGAALFTPLDDNERARVRQLLAEPEDVPLTPSRAELRGADREPSGALIVRLTQADVERIKNAAGDGCQDATGRWAQCSRALVIELKGDFLEETDEAFLLVLRYIREQWNEWCRTHHEIHHKRLFFVGPVALEFALGSIFARSLPLIPYRDNAYILERPAPAPPAPEGGPVPSQAAR